MTEMPSRFKVQFHNKKTEQMLARYAASLGEITGVYGVTLQEEGMLLCQLAEGTDAQHLQKIMGAVGCVLSSATYTITQEEEI